MKFPYPEMTTSSVSGMRVYNTPIGALPSITTVLGNTVLEEKKTSLNSWRNSLGHAKADKVLKDAGENGTAVHLLAERYLKKQQLIQDDKFNPEDISGFNALKMKLNKIDEVWGQEMALYSDLLQIAGRCDCAGVYKGVPSIIDFKTSVRLKGEKQIEDYKLQVTAYSCMHNERWGTDINHGVILMTSAGGFPQEFHIDLRQYVEPLVERVEKFYASL